MPLKTDLPPPIVDNLSTCSVIIPAGQTTSNVLTCVGFQPVALSMPSVWTSASITFLAALDGINFGPLTDYSCAIISLPVSSNYRTPLDANNFAGYGYFQIVSSVAQASDRLISFSLGPVFGQFKI